MYCLHYFYSTIVVRSKQSYDFRLVLGILDSMTLSLGWLLVRLGSD